MYSLKIQIGSKLKECRKERELTQAQVASAIGISQQQYMRYETGYYAPSYENLIALCKFFNVSSDYILGLTEY